jgi:hypothetical protein
MSDPAIRVTGLGKRYQLGARQTSYGSLRESLTGLPQPLAAIPLIGGAGDRRRVFLGPARCQFRDRSR